jgi:hypothetical protein
METVLGLFGLALYAACVVSLAAAITWVVVKISPSEKKPKKTETAEPAA